MIRQQAFAKTGNAMLKGGLHCHTTRSDGHGSPEEVIRLHASRGYDFLALTDHRRYNFTNFAPESGVLIVPGMEMDYNLPSQGPGCTHCYHIVALGPAEGNGFAQDQTFASASVAGQQDCQAGIDRIHAAGNLTFYAHPEWSSTAPEEFRDLRGNFAMEIWNTGCAMENDCDKDAPYWDLLLREGRRIFGVAVDDGHAMEQHCRGWVRVNAGKSVPEILAALEGGAFYSSCGPEIYDFYVEDGCAFVECSPVENIRFHYGYMPSRVTRRVEGPLTSASLRLPPQMRYIRASVQDANGCRAWTNPIFLK